MLNSSGKQEKRSGSTKKVKVPNLVAPAIQSNNQLPYEVEEQLLKNAHRVIINRAAEDGFIKKQFEKNQKAFINFTTVREMIDELALPALEKIPRLREELQVVQRDVALVKAHHKEFNNEMGKFRVRLGEINNFNTQLQLLHVQIAEDKKEVNADLQKHVNSLEELKKAQKKFVQDHIRQNDNIQEYSSILESFKVTMEQNFDKYAETFDEWFLKIATENRAMLEQDQKILTEHNELSELINNIRRDVDNKVYRRVEDLNKRVQMTGDSNKRLGRQITDLSDKLEKLSLIRNDLEMLKEENGRSRQGQEFICKSLPLLTHLQICEGLDRVCGNQFRESLNAFEQSKLNEIDEYTQHSHTSGIKIMSQRLATLSKFYREHQMGVLPFVFGDDASIAMSMEEASHLPPDTLKALQSKREEEKKASMMLQEAAEQVFADPRKRHTSVLRHKVQRLEPYQLQLLAERVLQHRVRKLGYLDDLNADPRSQDSGNSSSPARSKGRQGSILGLRGAAAASVHAPSQVYYVRYNNERGLAKLDDKFTRLYLQWLKQFSYFKKNQLQNFQKTTKMAMQMIEDIDYLRDANELNLADFDRKHEIDKQQIDKLKRDIEHSKEWMEWNVSKLQDESLAHEQLITNNKDVLELQASDIGMLRASLNAAHKKLQGLEEQVEEVMEMQETVGKLATPRRSQHAQNSVQASQSVSNANNKVGGLQMLRRGSTRHLSQSSRLEKRESLRRHNERRPSVTQLSVDKHSAAQKKKVERMTQQLQDILKRRVQDKVAQMAKDKVHEAVKHKRADAAMHDLLSTFEEERGEKKKHLLERAHVQKASSSRMAQVFFSQIEKKILQAKEAIVALQKDPVKKGEQQPADAGAASGHGGAGQEASQAPRKHGISVIDVDRLQLPNGEEASSSSGDEGDDPFSAFDAQQRGQAHAPQGGLDLEALQSTLQPIVEDITNRLNEIAQANIETRDQLAEQNTQVVELKAENCKMLQRLDETAKREQAFKEETNRVLEKMQQHIKAEFKVAGEVAEQHRQGMLKVKREVKLEAKLTRDKIDDLEDACWQEIRRMNSVTGRLSDGARMLLDAAMLSQLLWEQDVIDRKQIGLYGLKNNQQLMGRNQELKAAEGAQKAAAKAEPSKIQTQRKPAEEMARSVRGATLTADSIVSQREREASPLSPWSGGQGQARAAENNPRPPEQPEPTFMERYHKLQQYNTVTIKQNCGACRSEYNPHILSCLKVACLHYVNQPISYHGFEMSFPDVLQITELVLLQCQNYLEEAAELSQIKQSKSEGFASQPPLVDALSTEKETLREGDTGWPAALDQSLCTSGRMPNDAFELMSAEDGPAANLESLAEDTVRFEPASKLRSDPARSPARVKPRFQIDTLVSLSKFREQTQSELEWKKQVEQLRDQTARQHHLKLQQKDKVFLKTFRLQQGHNIDEKLKSLNAQIANFQPSRNLANFSVIYNGLTGTGQSTHKKSLLEPIKHSREWQQYQGAASIDCAVDYPQPGADKHKRTKTSLHLPLQAPILKGAPPGRVWKQPLSPKDMDITTLSHQPSKHLPRSLIHSPPQKRTVLNSPASGRTKRGLRPSRVSTHPDEAIMLNDILSTSKLDSDDGSLLLTTKKMKKKMK